MAADLLFDDSRGQEELEARRRGQAVTVNHSHRRADARMDSAVLTAAEKGTWQQNADRPRSTSKTDRASTAKARDISHAIVHDPRKLQWWQTVDNNQRQRQQGQGKPYRYNVS